MNSALDHPILYSVGKEDPYPELSKLIDAKVTRIQRGYWLISSYEACRQVSMDQINFSVKCRNKVVPYLLGMDPPKHLFARKQAAQLFSRETVQELSLYSRELSLSMCMKIKNQSVDFVDTIAFALPARTIGHFLGVTQDEQPQFNRWVQLLMYAPASMKSGLLSFSRFEKINGEIDRFFLKKLESHRGTSDERPPLYQWFHDQATGDPVLEQDFLKLVRTLMFAGIATVSCFISNTLRALQRDPELWRQIQQDLSFLPKVLEESLRHDPPVPHSEQTTVYEVEVGGVVIPPNQNIIPFFALANRDSSVFKDPHVFNPLRSDSGKHLSFGVGPHACMGAHLARMMATNLFSSLSHQFSHFQFEVEIEKIDWLAMTYLRGPRTLPVRFYS
jgi:cytochrome P450